MTGDELKAIRHKLGLTVVTFGRAIGYEGQSATVNNVVRRYEAGARPIPPWIARLALMFRRHGVPPEFLPDPSLDQRLQGPRED